jgi:cell division protein FtsW
MLKRTEESKLTSWYFETDRTLLWSVIIMMGISMWAMVSAGSVAAERIGQSWYFFILKALPFYGIGLITVFLSSMLDKKWARRISVLNVIVCFFLLFITLVHPFVIKGSARWVNFGFLKVMPSDILKPGFIVLTAWFLAKMKSLFGADMFKNKEAWRLKLFSWWSYIAVFAVGFLMIITQPDLGTSVLYLTVLGSMIFMAGVSWWIIPISVGLLTSVVTVAFFTWGHVHDRIISFVTGTGNTYQINQSIQSIQHGGLFGRGDDAFVKQSLPDAHTDFVFSALAEDMGVLVACVLLIFLLFVIKRLITDALHARDPFVFYAAGGTAVLFGTQVSINIMTALHILPPKGMTLPFISYGGSSLVSFCFLFGIILALIREDKWK